MALLVRKTSEMKPLFAGVGRAKLFHTSKDGGIGKLLKIGNSGMLFRRGYPIVSCVWIRISVRLEKGVWLYSLFWECHLIRRDGSEGRIAWWGGIIWLQSKWGWKGIHYYRLGYCSRRVMV